MRGRDRRVGVDGQPRHAQVGSLAGARRRRSPARAAPCPVTSPATSRAIGPTVSKLGDSGQTPSSGMRPQVVLSPAVPQQAAGMRTEPPVSLP